MNNSVFLHPINYNIIKIQPTATFAEEGHTNYPDYSQIFPLTHTNTSNSIFPDYSSIISIFTSCPHPIQDGYVESNAINKLTIKEDEKRESIKPAREHMNINEDKKVYEDRAIKSFQKLYRQVVTCYFCNKKVKKIKTFAYHRSYFVCVDCVVSNYISKSLLVDWDYEGDIECHKCKNKRYLSSFICYKENDIDFKKSHFCIYCRNMLSVFEMRRELKNQDK